MGSQVNHKAIVKAMTRTLMTATGRITTALCVLLEGTRRSRKDAIDIFTRMELKLITVWAVLVSNKACDCVLVGGTGTG